MEDISAIKAMLYKNPRNYALFVIGINTWLSPSALLSLTVEQVSNLQAKNYIKVADKKVYFNNACADAINRLLDSRKYDPDEFLFTSQRSTVLIISSLHRLVKSWCRAINIKGNYGSLTLCKTWGYHQRITFGCRTSDLVKVFGHASRPQTLSYLCIKPEDLPGLHYDAL
jgi:integrase